ncbi:NAD-dependent protein deacetylase [compost metagenome]
MTRWIAPSPLDRETLLAIADKLRRADHVLIGAGAGMSVDAGIDYADEEYFARRFPAMLQYGLRCQYQTIGFQDWSEAVQWGFLAEHVNAVRFESRPQPNYTQLRSLIGDKDHFVVTSNVDGMFAKSGFDEERIYTPQGSYALYQCLEPCSDQTWPFKPVIDRILPKIDPATQAVTDPDLIPRCPACGGPAFLNVRGGSWFLESPQAVQRKRYVDWVNSTADGTLLVIEIGSGFNTPGVIRWPMEQITDWHEQAYFVRVNADYPQVPVSLADRAIAIQARGRDVIAMLYAQLQGDASAS